MIILLLLKDIARWFFWFPLRWILVMLPLPVAYGIGTWLGYGFYLVARKRRARTESELRSLDFAKNLNPKTMHHIVRQSIVNMVLNHIDILLYQKLAKIPAETYTEIEGLDNLKAALSKNQGAILVHPHFGNPQILMLALGGRKFPINQIGRSLQDILVPESNESIDLPPLTPMLKRIMQIMHRLELALPAKFIYIHQMMLPAFRCLKQNEILAIAVDGLGGDNRVAVNMQGRQVSLSSGPVAIAQRSQAPILPTFMLRTKHKYRHRIIIEPPIELLKTDEPKRDWVANTQKIGSRIEEYLVKYPDQIARLFGNELSYFIAKTKI
ncbi:MAG: lysophospholipid acyltransferase family protein [bacterium]